MDPCLSQARAARVAVSRISAAQPQIAAIMQQALIEFDCHCKGYVIRYLGHLPRCGEFGAPAARVVLAVSWQRGNWVKVKVKEKGRL